MVKCETPAAVKISPSGTGQVKSLHASIKPAIGQNVFNKGKRTDTNCRSNKDPDCNGYYGQLLRLFLLCRHKNGSLLSEYRQWMFHNDAESCKAFGLEANGLSRPMVVSRREDAKKSSLPPTDLFGQRKKHSLIEVCCTRHAWNRGIVIVMVNAPCALYCVLSSSRRRTQAGCRKRHCQREGELFCVFFDF
jgi:hypothetical protein